MAAAGQELEAAVRDMLDRHPGLGILEAVLLAAVRLDLAADSRQLAKLLETEHALILRGLTGLVESGLLTVTARHTRSARVQVGAVQADRTKACAPAAGG